MRWLQWSTHDLRSGFGGVEVHARSVDRELRELDIDSAISSDESALQEPWDVIQTHGSAPLAFAWASRLRKRSKPPVLLHTLHGTTIGRMAACCEWLWPGGYAAYARELLGVMSSHAVVAVHSDLHLYGLARSLGRSVRVCGNGWDRPEKEAALSNELRARLRDFGPFFVFVGRGDDRVKDTELLHGILKKEPRLKLVTVPGDGFWDNAQILKTGPLSGPAVLEAVTMSRGLLLSSLYEGLPLVVLEALSLGVPVVSTRVGGIATIAAEVRGLTLLSRKAEDWLSPLEEQLNMQIDPPGLKARREVDAEFNRRLMPSWRNVAQLTLEAANEARERMASNPR